MPVCVCVCAGASLADVDHEGLDAVSWAAISGHLHCVELMLDRGSDIDHSDKIKRTPLHLASFYGHEQVVSCGNCLQLTFIRPFRLVCVRPDVFQYSR